MTFYYFNSNTDDKGNHEVHTDTCAFLPSVSNRVLIGYYGSCEEAIKQAQSLYPSYTFDGCYFCCHSCHKG